MKQDMKYSEQEWAPVHLGQWENADCISVLLIDASPHEAACLKQTILRGKPVYNFQVEQQETLIEGLNFLRTATADVLLLDLNLSGPDDFSDITFMHKLYPGLPIIVISNASSMETHRKALQSGAQAFMVKEQCNSIAIRNAICQVLSHQKIEKAYLQQGEKHLIASN